MLGAISLLWRRYIVEVDCLFIHRARGRPFITQPSNARIHGKQSHAMGSWEGLSARCPCMFAFVWQSAHESGAQMGYHVWYEINSCQEPGSMWRYTLMIPYMPLKDFHMSIYRVQYTHWSALTWSCGVVGSSFGREYDKAQHVEIDMSKGFSRFLSAPCRVNMSMYSMKNASHGNVIGPSLGSPNSSLDNSNSALRIPLLKIY